MNFETNKNSIEIDRLEFDVPKESFIRSDFDYHTRVDRCEDIYTKNNPKIHLK